MATVKPRKMATQAQRRAYLDAIQQKKPVPTGFIFDGVNVYVDDGVDRFNDGVGHGYYAGVAAVPVEDASAETSTAKKS